ncbi:LOW QUALITY PROTEIN: TSC complex subunit 1a [Poeciliopsis prolifica]|uniref:LOW QUALITY PROTEIN: TSC complex subunit 1a n=1 Tax=Poeciliopsis prolifica TaxID=188132 RepID=UPI002413C172|nr:LOW QUALITY PROTEIN: TSC complex subunit 1a [Poeciliopsis prolifica]
MRFWARFWFGYESVLILHVKHSRTRPEPPEPDQNPTRTSCCRMSREPLSVSDLLLCLESSELQELERVRTSINQQLSTDRGGAVLSSIVERYLDSSSSQVLLLLSSIREPHHKVLLEKLNEALTRPGNRAAAVTLLGHLIRKQPPWVHHISQAPVLPTLLRCLKTDGDVVVLVTGVLVLVVLLPMIPQAGKQHIYDFFDVFGRLASWSHRNPGQVSAAYLVHLHAAVYSLFHRLYGMFPCNFVSYLRLHYGMKENLDTFQEVVKVRTGSTELEPGQNLDTFQEVVKPMLEHVRIHPELVTGTQDYELDPSRWRCSEVHDIIMECCRLSLDPLEDTCYPAHPPHLDLSPAPQVWWPISSSGSSVGQLTLSSSHIQVDDVTWSPSSQCGLATPPPEAASPGPAPSLSRCTSISGVKCPSSDSVPVTTPSEGSHQPAGGLQVRPGVSVNEQQEDGRSLSSQVKQQPIRAQDETSLNHVVNGDLSSPDVRPPSSSSQFLLPTSTTSHSDSPGGPAPSPYDPAPTALGPTPSLPGPAPPYEPLFELALPHAATRFIRRKTQETLESAAGQQQQVEEERSTTSPLKVLEQMIVHGSDAHERLSRRSSTGSRSDRSHLGGNQPAPLGEELQRSQLLLVHSHLQYERFKRQQHAIRNRRLLRRVINATALEEQTVAMKAQLGVQDQEIRSLRSSLSEEQRRLDQLQQDGQTQTDRLLHQNQQLLLQQQRHQQEHQRLQSNLEDCHGRLRKLEAELQGANRKAKHAEHQLTQLGLKLCSSEQQQQQVLLLDKQLVLLRETNRALSRQLDEAAAHSRTEEAMLRRSAGNDFQRLKDCDVLQKQKLEAASHRMAELESQLARKDKLILELKKLLEETKSHSRAELSASESRCVALRRVSQTLQTEMLHLYSQVRLDTRTGSDTCTLPPLDAGSRNSPSAQDGNKPCPSSSSVVGIIKGAVEALSSSSPLSASPIDSPLAVGSFLEQQARRLFGQNDQSLEEEETEEVPAGSPPLGQEVEEATLLAGSPQTEPSAPAADLELSVCQRRGELGIMDYNESLPEF